MPPSLEVMMNHHRHHHHDELHHHSDLDMIGGVMTDVYDDGLLKANISADEEYDETENSEGDENNNGNDEVPTQARMVNGEDWNHIVKPGLHDVLLGRGGGTNNHSGNIKFRKLVNEHKMRYLACSKVEKPKVARQVVVLWRKLDPPGRFLARKDETKRGPGSVKANDNVWYEVGDKKAREKASQCLRERTPDVIPYIKHLREQQNAITEQGVSMVQMQMQQREQQQQVHLSPQRNNNNPHMNMIHLTPPSGGMPNHPTSAYGNACFDGPMTSPPVRRTSIGMVPPNSAPSMHFSPSQQHNNNMYPQQYQNSRRASMPLMTAVPIVDMGYDQIHDDHHFINSDVADMSDVEYQQQMMMMQQQMMQQQMQMQRLQQTRAMRVGLNRQPQSQQQHPHSLYHAPNGMHGMGVPMGPMHGSPQPPMYDTSPNPNLTVSTSNYTEQSSPKNKRGRDEGKTAPDRTTSLMSLTPACPDDHELSLEDYRQQLEEYIANSNKDDADPRGVYNNNDDGNESDLEDDWEKERERAVRQAQVHKKEVNSRGVNRNASGMSAMSGLLSTKSGMSLISGFSGFSDMSKEKNNTPGKTEREQKMSMARSVGSNISIMSELTDLSQNIDNLSIYDD